MSPRLSLLIRVLITLALLAFVFSQVEVGDVIADMRLAKPGLVLLAILFFVGAMLTNALKWGVLLRAQGVVAPWSALVRYTFVGFFFNNFLPAAIGGDVMRGYGLARYTNRNADAAVSVVVDRLIGLITLTGMAVVAVLYAQARHITGGTDLTGTFWGALVATFALMGAFLLMVSRRMRAWVGGVLERITTRLPLLHPLLPIYHKLADAIGAYREQPRAILLAFGIAVFTWVFSNIVNYLLSLSLPPVADGRAPIALLDVFIFNPIIGLTQTLPISIGGLGANQTFFDFFYHKLAGYDQRHVAATSLLMQFVVYFSSLPGGLVWWFDRGRTQTQDEENARPVAEAGEA